MGFPGGPAVKDLPAMQEWQETRVQSLGQRSPGGEKGKPLQYTCLENPMDRGAWWATVHRVAKSWKWLKQLSTHIWPLISAWLIKTLPVSYFLLISIGPKIWLYSPWLLAIGYITWFCVAILWVEGDHCSLRCLGTGVITWCTSSVGRIGMNTVGTDEGQSIFAPAVS